MSTRSPAGLALHAPTAADAGVVAALLRARGLRQFVPTCATAARTLLPEAGWWPVHHDFGMPIALTHAPDPSAVLAHAFETAAHRPTAATARRFESVGMMTAVRSERWEKVVGA